MPREVTERDFRIPEFRDAKVEDYEFDADDKPVRKDRWMTAVQSIRYLVGISGRTFEIAEVVDAVREMAKDLEGWQDVQPTSTDPDDWPETTRAIEIRLEDGSVLRNACYLPHESRWLWNCAPVPLAVVAWRDQPDR